MMVRAPLQVIVIPYRRRAGGRERERSDRGGRGRGDRGGRALEAERAFEFAVFHRTDGSMWHFVSGGAEDDESAAEAARREVAEEGGIRGERPWMALDSRASVPRTAFPTAVHWPDGLLVVPELAFAVDVTGCELVLSAEHDEVRWLPYEAAARLLTWDSNRTALWELAERLAARER